MKVKIQLSAKEKQMYAEDPNFKENFTLRIDVFNVLNDYLNREAAENGFVFSNHFIKNVLIPLWELEMCEGVNIKNYSYKVQSKETQH